MRKEYDFSKGIRNKYSAFINFIYFYPEKPFLINIEQSLFNKINNSPDWIAEKKYNGIRLQLHFFNNKFQFWNRHGEIIRYTPTKELQDSLNKLNLTGNWVFDGELRHNKTKNIQNKIIIFDVFLANNDLLINMPFFERRKILEKLFVVEKEPLGLIKQYKEDFLHLFKSVSKEKEIEGLVLKNINGILNLGRKNGLDSIWMYKIRKPSKNIKF